MISVSSYILKYLMTVIINGIIRQSLYVSPCVCIPEECDVKRLDVSLYRYSMPMELFRTLNLIIFGGLLHLGKWSSKSNGDRPSIVQTHTPYLHRRTDPASPEKGRRRPQRGWPRPAGGTGRFISRGTVAPCHRHRARTVALRASEKKGFASAPVLHCCRVAGAAGGGGSSAKRCARSLRPTATVVKAKQ